MCTTCRDSDEPQAVTTNWQRAFTVQEMMEGQPQWWAFSLHECRRLAQLGSAAVVAACPLLGGTAEVAFRGREVAF